MLGRAFVQGSLWLLPWALRRRALTALFGYEIDPSARIGFSLLLTEKLVLGAQARIGHGNLATGLHELRIEAHGSLGKMNRITAMPRGVTTFYSEDPDRDPSLFIGAHAAITNSHLIDCTDKVTIGAFTTFAGWRSQILTHSFDFALPRQRARPVTIGSYCFVGTGSILLSGTSLPDHSLLGAGSVLTKPQEESHMLYSGSPARAVRALDPALGYFTRTEGFIW